MTITKWTLFSATLTNIVSSALEKTLLDYHNRLIDAKEVMEQMIAIRQATQADDQRAEELGLTPEEIAFYDAFVANFITIYDQALLHDLVHDVVQPLKRNLKVDWTEPSREESAPVCGPR